MTHTLCARCGKLATHRARFNKWLDRAEAIPSRAPNYCRACATDEAERQTVLRAEADDWRREFDPATRLVYRTTAPLPPRWIPNIRRAVRQHMNTINPRGLVEMYTREHHVYLEVYPPKGAPDTWTPDNCLYLLRYLVKLPLVFAKVERGESPSPATYRESREPLRDTTPQMPATPAK